jgi:hypothetical protein
MAAERGCPLQVSPDFPDRLRKVSGDKLANAADLLEGRDDAKHCKWESSFGR